MTQHPSAPPQGHNFYTHGVVTKV